jgi:hypothetical protein
MVIIFIYLFYLYITVFRNKKIDSNQQNSFKKQSNYFMELEYVSPKLVLNTNDKMLELNTTPKKRRGRPPKYSTTDEKTTQKKIGRPLKYTNDEERIKARNESILKSVHKLRYTEEEVQRKLKLYEEKLRSKLLTST